MAKEAVEVRMKMTPLQAGTMYMVNMRLKKRIKELEAMEEKNSCPNLIDGVCELTGRDVMADE